MRFFSHCNSLARESSAQTLFDLQWNCSFHSISQLGCLWHKGSRDLGQLSLAHSGSKHRLYLVPIFFHPHCKRTQNLWQPVPNKCNRQWQLKGAKYSFGQTPADQLRSKKKIKVWRGCFNLPKLEKQAEEADEMSSSWVSHWRTGCLSVVPGEAVEGRDMLGGAMQVRNSELSALVNTVSARVYEGY